MLMSDSLGGNAKTLMIVNISPADDNVEETLSSLQYAQRVKQIKNKTKANVDSAQVRALKQEVVKVRADNLESPIFEATNCSDAQKIDFTASPKNIATSTARWGCNKGASSSRISAGFIFREEEEEEQRGRR